MGAIVHDTKDIGDRMLGELKRKKKPPCHKCGDTGWIPCEYMVGMQHCDACSNPKGLPSP